MQGSPVPSLHKMVSMQGANISENKNMQGFNKCAGWEKELTQFLIKVQVLSKHEYDQHYHQGTSMFFDQDQTARNFF